MPLGSLPNDVQKQVEALLQKEPAQLTPAEHNFLRGRRDYLSSDQRKYYGLHKAAVEPTQNDGEGDGEGENKPFNRKEAIARLVELEVDFKKNVSNAKLQELLEEHDTDEDEDDE